MAAPPVVIERSHLHVAPEVLEGKTRDVLVATWEERRWVRRRARTAGGREIALALETGQQLPPGAVIHVGDDWFLEVEAALEPVLAVYPADRAQAIRTAFEVGNLHFTVAIDGERLLVPDDSAMVQLLTRLGVRFERERAVFHPVSAGHRHDH
jgi:urease accessory protein